MTHRILVVDDQNEYTKLFKEYLVDYGYDVSIAESGVEAKQMFERSPFDLVITDVVMPGVDGVKLIGHIRSIKPDTGFIVMTGFSNKELDEKVEKLNVAAYLKKPFRLTELKDKVINYFNNMDTFEPLAKPLDELSWSVFDCWKQEDWDSFMLQWSVRIKENSKHSNQTDAMFKCVNELASNAMQKGPRPDQELAYVIEGEELILRLKGFGHSQDGSQPYAYELYMLKEFFEQVQQDAETGLYYKRLL